MRVEKTTWGDFKRMMDEHTKDDAEVPFELQAWRSAESPGTYDLYRVYRFYERPYTGLSADEIARSNARIEP